MPMRTAQEKREYQNAWMRRRRQEWIDARGGRCATCGATDRLEVDHVDPSTKEMNVSLIWSRRADIREAELAKCQVLCYGCHKLKTRIHVLAPCGTRSAYDRGCRCGDCRDAKTAAMQEYRNRVAA